MSSGEKVYEMPNFIEARSDFIEVHASDIQPSLDVADAESLAADIDDKLIFDSSSSEEEVEEEPKEGEFVYKGIETTHTFEKMEQANQLIGGATIATKAQEANKKTHYISIEDVDDEDTKEFKEYKNFNKDHKVFAFSMPLGQNTNTASDVSPISQFKTIKPENPTDEEVCKIKHKLKKTSSIDSLEEFLLFSNETGVKNGRAEAIKGVLPTKDIKRQVKSMTIDANEQTSDGYYCKRLDSIWNELEGDVVIMGGYRGSKLVDRKTGKKLWIPIKAGFNMSSIDLLIGPTDKDEQDAVKKVKSSGMLTHVGPVDVSRKLIRKLASNPKVHITDFGYDWRVSLSISAEQLKDYLTTIYNKQKEKKGIYIIAHSMGGLVAHKVLQEYTHLVRGIIYVGSPSQCPNIIGPFRFGDEVMYNKTLLSKENNFFMRSSFHFCPNDGRCFIDKNTYERYDINFFDPAVWKKLGLSPCVSDKRKKISENKKLSKKILDKGSSSVSNNPLLKSLNNTTKFVFGNVPVVKKVVRDDQPIKWKEVEMENEDEFRISYEDSVKYLERTLKRTKEYLDSLDYRPNKEYPPLAIVYGNKVPTVRGCKVNGVKDIQDGQYGDFYYGPGDGVVHYKWLLPERRGFPVVCKVASQTGHVSLMTDLDAIAKAFISVVDAEKETAERRKAHFMG
ncbi:hypothetical protein MOUN0_E03004 [Monosporozyma unispora]|nr:hypothetical protein C6P44_003680 [Kazachstania unispora]